MKKYNIVISAVCPPEKRWKWEQEEASGYTVTTLGSTVRLEGRSCTEEDFPKLQPLINEFTDHHVHVEEVKNDGQEARQTPPLLSPQGVEQRLRSRTKTPLVLCDRNPQGNPTRSDTRVCDERSCAIWAECQRRLRASGDA